MQLSHIETDTTVKRHCVRVQEDIQCIQVYAYILNITYTRTHTHKHTQSITFVFWFLVCYAATKLANQLQQTRIQVVRSNKVAQKHLTESNGTPTMYLGHMNVILK